MKFFSGHILYGFALLAAGGISINLQERFLGLASAQSTTIYETDVASLNEILIKNNHGGYSGEGYADYKKTGSYVEWTIDVVESGDYQLGFRYSAAVSRPCELIVDGIVSEGNPIRPLLFIKTGGWSSWNIETLPLYMTRGTHTLKVLAVSSTGPNLDWLSLTPSIHDRLEPDEDLEQGEYIPSPSGRYEFGLSLTGSLVLLDRNAGNTVVWSPNVSRIDKCRMQDDGNFVCKYDNGDVAYGTRTFLNDGAHLLVCK